MYPENVCVHFLTIFGDGLVLQQNKLIFSLRINWKQYNLWLRT